MRFYHFTCVEHLDSILHDGQLRPTESNLAAPWEPDDVLTPNVVWLVDTPKLGGLSHGLRGSVFDKTAVRFAVDVPGKWVLRFLPWADAQGIHPDWKSALIDTGGGIEAAEHWFVMFRPVRQDRWAEVALRDENSTYCVVES